MEGLTYETKSQADTAVEDYRNEGLLAKAIRTKEGKYRVLIVESKLPEVEEELAANEFGEEEEEYEKEEKEEIKWKK